MFLFFCLSTTRYFERNLVQRSNYESLNFPPLHFVNTREIEFCISPVRSHTERVSQQSEYFCCEQYFEICCFGLCFMGYLWSSKILGKTITQHKLVLSKPEKMSQMGRFLSHNSPKKSQSHLLKWEKYQFQKYVLTMLVQLVYKALSLTKYTLFYFLTLTN